MLRISFLLVCEGSSDAALIPHLEDLCVLCGADEVTGVAPNLALLRNKVGHGVLDKLTACLQLERGVDMIFVHRDSDGPTADHRRSEIVSALRRVETAAAGIPLVPVQETEAWLILDERQIRVAADNPNGRTYLAIPTPEEVESIAQPKEALFNLLRRASGLTGRRLQQFERSLHGRRRRLLEDLRCDGPVSRVLAWQRLRTDIQNSLDHLAQEST